MPSLRGTYLGMSITKGVFILIRDIFSKRFLLLKKNYQLSYTDFMEILGTKNKTTVNDWVKSQKGFPNEAMLVLISDIFAISLDWLLGRIDEPYNESILTKLEEEHAVGILEMAVATPITPLPEEYKNTELRRKYYTQGQRANLIYAAMSSFYKTLFSMFTLKQIEKGEMDLRTLDDAILNGYITNIKDIRPLLYRELDAPVFDLEAAIG